MAPKRPESGQLRHARWVARHSLGEGRDDEILDRAAQRARAELGIVAELREPGARARASSRGGGCARRGRALAQLGELELDDALERGGRERPERDDRVEAAEQLGPEEVRGSRPRDRRAASGATRSRRVADRRRRGSWSSRSRAMRKSTSRPSASVSRPSPITPSRRSNAAASAFSISSNSTTESGWRRMRSASEVPRGDGVIRRAIADGVTSSLMSTRTSRSASPNR